MSTVSSPNLPAASALDEVLGNLRAGSHATTVRVRVGDLATAMVASGPIHDAVVGVSAGMVVALTATDLQANLAYVAGTGGWVVGTGAGIYRKTGASGAGGWTRIGDLPGAVVIATDTGLGTANAIQATTSGSISTTALICMILAKTNTSTTVTVVFNGSDTSYRIKTGSGQDPVVGGLRAGMAVVAIVVGSTLRLLSDQSSSDVLAAAEAALAQAQALVTAVASVFPISAGTVGGPQFRMALASAGLADAVEQALPADGGSPVRIAFYAALIPRSGIVAAWLASDSGASPPGPGLTTAQITALFSSALTKVL